MSEQATPPPAVTPPPDEHQRVEAAAEETGRAGVVVRPDDEQFGRPQPGLGHRPGGVDHHRSGDGGRPVRLRRQHAHHPSLRLGDRRRQHRHDVRDHRRRHRPVSRRDRRACVGLGDDPRHPDDGGEHHLARHGVSRLGRGHRLRCGQRHLDRLREAGTVHRHARHARGSTRPGRDHLRPQDPNRGRPGVRRVLWRELSRDPEAGVDLRPGLGHRLGAAQPDHIRTPHDLCRWQRRWRPALLASMSSGTRCSSTCSWASPAASPQS